ncbi:MAG: pentapeptide repeat-containing protein [Actinobacteria bacterium]|nr:pentapeptide repeat-containing protein [Actinomycetota bacterium]
MTVASLVLAVLVVSVLGVFVTLAYRSRWQWTGLPASRDPSTGAERPPKTLWDWLQLLGIPVALAALAFLLNDAQSRRDEQREDRRAAQQRIAAADAGREDTLRSYLEQMSELMLDRGLLRSARGADVRSVARTATLTAVRRLDGARRGLVVRFLVEARLLDQAEGARVFLGEADLAGADLAAAELVDADLSYADLSHAQLRDAKLHRAVLSATRLVSADLVDAELFMVFATNADLRKANLSRAILASSDFGRADFSDANLSGANLSGFAAGAKGAILSGGDLTGIRGEPAHDP